VSDLIAVAYPDQQTAETVRLRLARLTREHAVELEDAVVVTRDENGKVKLHQAVNMAGHGAASGALWGGLIGLLFLAPLVGMAVGAAAGGAGGAATDVGINDQFMKELGGELTPGSAAVMVSVRKVSPDKVLPEISQYGGRVIQTSLDDESENRLREVLEAGQPAAAQAG
jgi:uncharacterized membrane protein